MPQTQSRRERKKQQTREAIVTAARELFAEHGYDETTIPQIAESANVAVSTVFAHFPTKDDIFFSGWTAMTEDLERFLTEAPESETVLDGLRRWYADCWPRYVESSEWWGVERNRIIARTPSLDAQRRHRLAKLQRVYAVAFGRDMGEEPGALRPRLLASATVSATMLINEYWYERGLAQGFSSPADVADYAFALIDASQTALAELDPPPF